MWKVLSYTPRSVGKETLNKGSYLFFFLQYWLWFLTDLRWLDWIFLGGYFPSLSINYVAMSKDMGK